MDVEFMNFKAVQCVPEQRLSALISSMGTPVFENVLMDIVGQHMRCNHLTTFSQRIGEAPKVLIAIDKDNPSLARRIAAKYTKRYWKLDPVIAIARAEPRIGAGAMIRLRHEDIENEAYRRDCYGVARLVDRLSIVRSQSQTLYRLNFYRDSTHRRFSDDELKSFSGFATLLLEIVTKHDQIRPKASEDDQVDLWYRRLNGFPFLLSPRACQICVEIVLGRTSEAIAAKLGLSVNTVLTHRKRAYAKLNISSQNELSRIVLQ